jgi:RNA polymerase sigma-70 factor (ECF subfamily)
MTGRDIQEKIIRQYADMVYRIAFTNVKNKTDADDVFQNVFLRLCKTDTVFESDEHIRNWLIRATVNVCKSFFTSAWRRNTVELDDTVSYNDDSSYVADAVRGLPQKYSIVVYLHYYEGYETKEIASILSIGESAVKVRMHRARTMLKKKLKGVYDDI